MKYKIDYTNKFKKQHKKIKKQGKNMNKLYAVISALADGVELNSNYLNHKLIDNRAYKGCSECHIEPDWLLIYKVYDTDLILILVAAGSHSELLDK